VKSTRITLTALALVIAVGATACGGSDGGDDASAAEPTPTTTTVLDQDVPGMEAAVAGLIDYGAHTPAELAAALAGAGNEDLVPVFDSLHGVVDGFKVEFKVMDSQVQGATAVASVQITSNGEPFPDLYPVFFERGDGGAWKVTRAGFCSIVIAGGLSCPDTPTTAAP
jgi:hypothetical protein